jgi:tRNA-Thr(GGU) m(6)t(6)A37 methyltransferase TsaA
MTGEIDFPLAAVYAFRVAFTSMASGGIPQLPMLAFGSIHDHNSGIRVSITSTSNRRLDMRNLMIGTLLIGLALVSLPRSSNAQPRRMATESETTVEFKIQPIGHVKKTDDRTFIVLDKKYQPGLLGLDGFSHINVFWWFDRNDTPQGRSVLQVHPRGNRENPLTGVFATRSPRRPNLIALTLCKIVAVKENVIEIEKTDAFDGTPVLDIKPYLPGYDTTEDAKIPDWVGRMRQKGKK